MMKESTLTLNAVVEEGLPTFLETTVTGNDEDISLAISMAIDEQPSLRKIIMRGLLLNADIDDRDLEALTERMDELTERVFENA